jgi:hypothetical protein
MNNIATKTKIGVIVVLTLVFLFATGLAVYAAGIKSLISPAEFDLLGAGFNSITQSYIFDNKCLKYSTNITPEIQGVINSTAYYFVNSKKELADKFLYNFAATPGTTPDTTVKSRLTEMIVNNTVFSTDKITLLAYWKQEDKKMFSNDVPVMTEEGISILRTNPKNFFQTYGDKYISSVTFGKMFFIIYQADISNFSSYSTRAKNAIKRAMELNLKKILGLKLSPQETAFVGERLADVNISSNTYGTNLNGFSGPYSAEEYNELLKKVNAGPSEIIERELKNYSNVYNRSEDVFYNITEYLNMAEQWGRHLAFFDYIMANSKLSFDLLTQCRLAADKINDQLKLVYALDRDARIPSTRESNNFNDLYNRYVTEMKISPRTYTLPSPERQEPGDRLELDLSNINDVESIRIDCICYNQTRVNTFWVKKKPIRIVLSVVDEDGNLSEVGRTLVLASDMVTLYEGIKMADKFRLRFWNAGNKPDLWNPWIVTFRPFGFIEQGSRRSGPYVIVRCSYTEKVYDIIWIYLHSKTAR